MHRLLINNHLARHYLKKWIIVFFIWNLTLSFGVTNALADCQQDKNNGLAPDSWLAEQKKGWPATIEVKNRANRDIQLIIRGQVCDEHGKPLTDARVSFVKYDKIDKSRMVPTLEEVATAQSTDFKFSQQIVAELDAAGHIRVALKPGYYALIAWTSTPPRSLIQDTLIFELWVIHGPSMAAPRADIGEL